MTVWDEEFIAAVARRWWDQDPEAWREEGHDRPDDLRKDVRQVLRCASEEAEARMEERRAALAAEAPPITEED